MLCIRGNPALSAFRLAGLRADLRRQTAAITAVHAEFEHFVATSAPLTEAAQMTLLRLLSDGPAVSRDPASSRPPDLRVIPRPGTISPWSSKATDIAHNCGLQGIQRIERDPVSDLTG